MLDLKALAEDCNVEATLPSSIIILNQTNQLKAMTTIIRDKESEPEDFIFYLERTSSLVLERYTPLEGFLMTGYWMNYRIHQRRSRRLEDIRMMAWNYRLGFVVWRLSALEGQ